MRIGTYNIYRGARDTFDELTAFVEGQNLDVVGFQETNGWQADNLAGYIAFAKATGMEYWEYGDTNSEFKLATFSRLPIVSSTVHTEGFRHGAVHTVIDSGGDKLHVWNTHLNPRSEPQRAKEAQWLISVANPDEDTVIMGDINSLSSEDNYPESLPAHLAAQSITKFGAGSLLYDVTNCFAQAGLVDAAAKLNARETTVPTPANKDPFHAAPMRLDYIWVSGNLAMHMKEIETVKNDQTDVISDHYPLVLTLG